MPLGTILAPRELDTCEPNHPHDASKMKSSDPASLQNLNDIVTPAAVGWWPLASGWYLLLGVFSFALIWLAYRLINRWFANRYRRAALRELLLLKQAAQSEEMRASSLRQLPVLLKRTALSAYPRSDVASLSGNDWYQFLNSSLKEPVFTASMSITLGNISYSSRDTSAIDKHASEELIAASAQWMKHHRPATRLKEAGHE
jgi:hypothetical protein